MVVHHDDRRAESGLTLLQFRIIVCHKGKVSACLTEIHLFLLTIIPETFVPEEGIFNEPQGRRNA